MTVAAPAPNRKVIATSSRRFWKADAKYAGSITETQHGANSAIAPAMTAANDDGGEQQGSFHEILRFRSRGSAPTYLYDKVS